MPKLDKKCRICRSAGEKLFLKGDRCYTQKCAMVRNSARPGVHSRKRVSLSEFGLQLKEKQKARFAYKLSEKQFGNYINQVFKRGASAHALMAKLERRLDNAVYRLGFAVSRSVARQLVNHGHFYVNGRKIDIPSYEVKVNDTIEIAPTSKDLPIFKNLKEPLKKYVPPAWLTIDKETLKGQVKSLPAKEDLITSFNTNLIIEYYSK